MFVSIIVTVYKVEDYIESCLDSIISANMDSTEVILVVRKNLRESIDVQYCKQVASRHDNIYVIEQPRIGLSDARNAGMKAAKGDYIVFFDGDDLIDSSLWDRTIMALKELDKSDNTPDVIVSDYSIIDNSGNKIKEIHTIDDNALIVSDTYIYSWLMERRNYWNIWQYIYKREYILEQGMHFIENTYSEDLEFSTKVICSMQNKNIGFSGYRYYDYRIGRNDSLATHITYKHIEDLMNMLEKSMQYADKAEIRLKKLIYNRLQLQYILCFPMIYDIREERDAAIACIMSHKSLLKRKETKKLYVLIGLVPISISARLLQMVRWIRRKLQGR